jgi:hypothetical protein
LAPHYDGQDLVIAQLSGTKTWRFLGDNIGCGVRRHRSASAPKSVSGTATMRPGDLLFVPAGLHHVCEAEGHSLHLAFQIEHASGRDLIRHLMDEHLSLNRPFRRFLGRETLVEQARSLRTELAARLEEFDIEVWLSAWNAGRSSVTEMDLGDNSDEKVRGAEAVAVLALTIPPDVPAGAAWKAGGAEFQPLPGAAEMVEALKAGPIRVSDLLAMRTECGPHEVVQAAVDQLVSHGVVRLRRGGGQG